MQGPRFRYWEEKKHQPNFLSLSLPEPIPWGQLQLYPMLILGTFSVRTINHLTLTITPGSLSDSKAFRQSIQQLFLLILKFKPQALSYGLTDYFLSTPPTITPFMLLPSTPTGPWECLSTSRNSKHLDASQMLCEALLLL